MASLNMQHKDEVAITIQNLLDYENEGRSSSQLPPSIQMVPSIYRDQKPSCFDPQVISIGPFHRAHKNVQEHKGLKATYLHDLLARLNSPRKQTLEACLKKVLGSIDEFKVCYSVGMINYDDFELANMMVIDACFILEFLMKCREGKGLCPGNTFVMNRVSRDLVLLENQIPFFVLQDIFDITLLHCAQSTSLITLILYALNSLKPFEDVREIDNHTSDRYYYKHILDILHKAYKPPSTSTIPSRLLELPVSHSAIELDLSGVNFKPLRDRNWPMAMEYESSYGFLCFRSSTLRMPVVSIQDDTELVFRNLIAYEQSSSNGYYYITSYAWAMDMLVSNAGDVIKLIESKVIVNYLSNENAADMINNICNEIYYTEFFYESQWKQLDGYYNRYWPKNIAWLRRTYFSSPWNMIALVALIVLFALTVTQTFFTVKSTL